MYKYHINREFLMDHSDNYEQLKEETKMTDLTKTSPYTSTMNIDNHPTHENEDGLRYAGGSKNWRLVDPRCDDDKSMHNASFNQIYLLLKNKHSGDWEFPSTDFFFGTSFYKARVDLFESFASGWSVEQLSRHPQMHTIRPFTEHEKSLDENFDLHGVRTYYF